MWDIESTCWVYKEAHFLKNYINPPPRVTIFLLIRKPWRILYYHYNVLLWFHHKCIINKHQLSMVTDSKSQKMRQKCNDALTSIAPGQFGEIYYMILFHQRCSLYGISLIYHQLVKSLWFCLIHFFSLMAHNPWQNNIMRSTYGRWHQLPESGEVGGWGHECS